MVEWISHRGLRKGCEENTERAFILAKTAGFTWLETDLRCTKDGVLVHAHDNDLQRVFGSSLIVEEAEYPDLTALRSPYGDSLLKFEQFASQFSELNWVLDVKPESAEKTVVALAGAPFRKIIEERLLGRIKFLFWDGNVQELFLRIFPRADCFARQSECWKAGLASLVRLPSFGGIVAGKTYSVPPDLCGVSLYSKGMFSRYHRKDAKVLAYLPVSKEQCQAAVAAGADFVLVNEDLFNS